MLRSAPGMDLEYLVITGLIHISDFTRSLFLSNICVCIQVQSGFEYVQALAVSEYWNMGRSSRNTFREMFHPIVGDCRQLEIHESMSMIKQSI